MIDYYDGELVRQDAESITVRGDGKVTEFNRLFVIRVDWDEPECKPNPFGMEGVSVMTDEEFDKVMQQYENRNA